MKKLEFVITKIPKEKLEEGVVEFWQEAIANKQIDKVVKDYNLVFDYEDPNLFETIATNLLEKIKKTHGEDPELNKHIQSSSYDVGPLNEVDFVFTYEKIYYIFLFFGYIFKVNIIEEE